MKPKISTIISYCSNDKDFIDECIEHALPFSQEISVCSSSHFFDGMLENFEEKLRFYKKYEGKINPISFPFDSTKHPGQLHNRMRAWGWKALTKPVDWILFLDADEIVDTEKFITWINSVNLEVFTGYRFIGYWYFRDTCWQANSLENVSVLAKASKCSYEFLDNCLGERLGLLDSQSVSNVKDLNNQSMFHHYSWARTKEGMIRKAKSWGHHNDKDWLALIEQEFKRDFNETCIDFVHGYSFKKVEPFINVRIT